MKKFSFTILSALLLFTASANSPVNYTRGNDPLTNNVAPKRLKPAAQTKSMTWTPIILPFCEAITIDTNNGQVNGFFLERGFTFTVQEPQAVVFLNPSGGGWFYVYTDKIADTLILLSSGTSSFINAEPGETYHVLIDDGGNFVIDETFTTMTVNIFADNNFAAHKNYDTLDYSAVLDEQHPVEGIFSDTVLFDIINGGPDPSTSTSQAVYISDYNASSFTAEADHLYLITTTYASDFPENVLAGIFLFTGGNFSHTIADDLKYSAFALNEGESDTFSMDHVVFTKVTATYRVMPFAYMGGVYYRVSIKDLGIPLTVPELLNNATELTVANIPYSESGDFTTLPIVTSGDGSLLGNSMMPNYHYHATARKMHLNEGDVIYISFEHSAMLAGYIYLYEKENDATYLKIGEMGCNDTTFENPSIVYTSDREKDLYIVGTAAYYYPLGYGDDGDYTFVIDTTIPLSISNLAKRETLRIAPNPVQDKLNIAGLSGNENISVLDISGRMVMSCKGTTTIDVSSLKSGIYVLRASGVSGVSTAKFIKK
ncbi:MAG: T9SS type A sorting domain-containing protein [Bacteroidales bacterium]|jgi:hypothetical protein|nr:T9SS type A sorting domain-containing protein [Bacteroidales bacterium]